MSIILPFSPAPTPANAGDMCGLVHRPDSFVDGLLRGGDLERVAAGIVAVVDASFETHPMRGGSNRVTPEWTSRRDLCVQMFREMQGDLKWTTDRALSMLRPRLAARLDGRPDPLTSRGERRGLWAPDGGLAAREIIHVDDVALAPPGPDGGVESLAELKETLTLDDDGDD